MVKIIGIVVEIRDVLLSHQNNKCFYCGVESPTQIDHVYPRKKNGRDSALNMVMACARCNQIKNAHSMEAFREKMAFNRSEYYGLISLAQYKKMLEVNAVRNIEPFVFHWEKVGMKTLVEVPKPTRKKKPMKMLNEEVARIEAKSKEDFLNKLIGLTIKNISYGEKWVLVMIAHNGDEYGVCTRVSIEDLASMGRMSVRSVYNHLKSLIGKKYISIDSGTLGKHNKYIINQEKIGWVTKSHEPKEVGINDVFDIEDANMQPMSRLILIYLVLNKDSEGISLSSIAKKIGTSKQTVISHLAKLKGMGYISVQKREGDGKGNLTNKYEVII